VVDAPSPVLALSSFTGSAAAFAALALAGADARPGRTPLVVAVTPGLPEADQLEADLGVLSGESAVRVLSFPPPLVDDRSTTAARLKAAAALGSYRMRPYPLVIVAPAAALAVSVPSAAVVAAASFRLACDGTAETLSFEAVQARLRAGGYVRAPEVTEPGTYAVRGGVLDAWAPDETHPVRAEYFGDELESLRLFDPVLQTSIRAVDAADFPPVELAEEDRPRATLLEVLPAGATVLCLEYNDYATLLPSEPGERRFIYTGDPAPRGVPTADFLRAAAGFRGAGLRGGAQSGAPRRGAQPPERASHGRAPARRARPRG